MSSPPEPSVPSITEWCFRGLILPTRGDTGPRVGGGVLDLDELSLFVHRVHSEMPGATIICHEYGLRAIHSSKVGDSTTPKLDWDDWL